MTIHAEELEQLLRLAARAMGLKKLDRKGWPLIEIELPDGDVDLDWWRPDLSDGQCAEMNAALGHDTTWLLYSVCVANATVYSCVNHDGDYFVAHDLGDIGYAQTLSGAIDAARGKSETQ